MTEAMVVTVTVATELVAMTVVMTKVMTVAKGSSGLRASDMTPGPVLGRVREISTRGDRWTAGLLPLGR